MDTNRSVLIIQISKSGQGIESKIFYNDAESGESGYVGSVAISDIELDGLCADMDAALSKIGHPDSQQSRLLADIQRCGRSLFDRLFDTETRRRLKDSRINYAALSIDEELMCIPWELLYDGEEFLCLRFALGRIVGRKAGGRQERFKIKERDSSRMISALVMAPSSSYIGLTYHEGIAVINKLYSRHDRIRALLKVMDIELKFINDSIKRSDIVHFLGHVRYDAHDSSKAGWVFKDGIFSVEKIRSLSAGSHFPFFIFSNAIQYGKQEGWLLNDSCKQDSFAIANSFILAGTRYYAGNFWRIPDEARLLFVREFYGFAVEGFPLGEAFRLSRLKLIEAYGRPSLFWAVYFICGNPAISLFEEEVPLSRPAKEGTFNKEKSLFLVSPVGRLKKITVAIAVILLIFAGSSIVRFLSTLELLAPEFRAGLKYLLSQHKSAKDSREGIVEELSYLARAGLAGDAGTHTKGEAQEGGALNQVILQAEKGAAAEARQQIATVEGKDIWSDLSLLQQRGYLDLLIKDAMKSISDPGSINKEARRYCAKARKYINTGRYGKADRYVQKALEISKKSNDPESLLSAAIFLAYTDIQNGRTGEARTIMSESENIFEKAGDKSGIAGCLFSLGLIYAMPKDFNEKKSVDCLEKAANTYISIGDEKNAAYLYLASGYVYISAKSYPKAVKRLAEGLKLAEKSDNKQAKALIYKAIGDAFFARQKYALAKPFYNRALLLNEGLDSRMNKIACIDILYLFSLQCLKEGDIDTAAGYCRRVEAFAGNMKDLKMTGPYSNAIGLVRTISCGKGSTQPAADRIYFDMAAAYLELGYFKEADALIDRGTEYKAKKGGV